MELKLHILYFASIKEILGKISEDIILQIKDNNYQIDINELSDAMTSQIKYDKVKLYFFNKVYYRCMFAVNDE